MVVAFRKCASESDRLTTAGIVAALVRGIGESPLGVGVKERSIRGFMSYPPPPKKGAKKGLRSV